MFLLFFTSLVFAEDRKVRYQRETEIDFDALDITGEMVKPQGSIIMERQGAVFNPLIQLRTDWDKEMHQSIRSIK